MKAIGYIRVSTEEQVKEGISLETQEDRICTYAKLHNLGEVKIIKDAGKTGKDLNREGIQEVIRLAKEKQFSHLIVCKMDRLTRKTLDLLSLVEDILVPSDIVIHSINEKIDTASAQGKFFLTIIGGMAQMERDLISERTKEALKYKISLGEPVGSPPLGFSANGDKKLHSIQDELDTIIYIKNLNKKLSLRQVANELNKQGIPTKRGGKWYAGTIRYILRNNRYNQASV